MSERLVIDWSFAHQVAEQVKAVGYEGAVRYLAFVEPDTVGKIVTRDEVNALHAAGLTVRLNWEYGANDMLGGAPAGQKAGAEANRLATALGAPAFLPIYYSCDFDAQPSQFPFLADYLRAAKLASGRPVGVYGSANVVEAMLGRGAATIGWQTEAWSSVWNPATHEMEPRVSPVAHLYQRVGRGTLPGSSTLHDIDENVICHEDNAAWYPPGAPAEHPIPTLEDDMATLVEATDDSTDTPVTVKKGNVFAVTACGGFYIAGSAEETAVVSAGIAKPGRHKLHGDLIRKILKAG